MSSQDNQDLSRAYIDGFEFARDGRHLQGVIPLANMGRLADLVLDQDGELACQIVGEQDRSGEFLQLRVAGVLNLCCQRCLGALSFPLRVRKRLRLMRPGAEWPEDDLEDDAADAVEATKEMLLLPLIEEEVLLALPIAPRHEACTTPTAAEKDQALSPFSALAKLKK
jgi:uncharacterized protein